MTSDHEFILTEESLIVSTCKALSYAIRAWSVRMYGSSNFAIPPEIPWLWDSRLNGARNVRTDMGLLR